MKQCINLNRSGRANNQPAGGSIIPPQPDAEEYSGRVVLVASTDEDIMEYAIISLQDYENVKRTVPVYAVLYTFLKTSTVSDIVTDEYRVDYIGRVTGVSSEFETPSHRAVRTFAFCGLWKAGQGALDSWAVLGENNGMFTARNLEYGDLQSLSAKGKISYFRPANDVVLSDDTLTPIVGSDYASSKWELQTAISDPASTSVEVLKWSGVKADGTTTPLFSYKVARFGVGSLSAGMARLNPERYMLQFSESANESVSYFNLFAFASPVAIDPSTSELYWLCFSVQDGYYSMSAYFSKTGAIPVETFPFATNVCPLVPCAVMRSK